MTSTPASLYESIRSAIGNQQTAAIIAGSVLEPVTGVGSTIQPVTYTDGSYATAVGFLPDPAQGWQGTVTRDADNRPVQTDTVVIDSVGSQANRSETALWSARQEIKGLPGVIVSGADVPDAEVEKAYATATKGRTTGVAVSLAQFRSLLDATDISTWTASHRHSDAWIRYSSQDESGATAWSQDGGLRELITTANSTQDATTLYENFINSLIYGYWTSSGVIQRHRQARIYSSEIVGYGVNASAAGAGKYELLPVSNKVATAPSTDGFTSQIKESAAKTTRPSTLGFGMIPSDAKHHGFVCETILRRASISLSALRAVRFGPDAREKTSAAAAVVTSLAILGHELSSYETHLRSGCDLITTQQHYGIRTRGEVGTTPLNVPSDVDLLIEVVDLARRDAEKVGLRFADPIRARMSTSEVGLVAASAVIEAKQGETEA